MATHETAPTAETFFGDKPYQKRARRALPLLVRQAQSHKTIFYAQLAAELGMSNPRNLNYVLGSVGQTLVDLSKRQNTEIPPIQCVVVNQSTELPGNGVSWFIDNDNFARLSLKQKRAAVEVQLQNIFLYPDWNEVLSALDLEPVPAATKDELLAASNAGRKGGESDSHRNMKDYIAANPHVVGLPKSTAKGATEVAIPSGDLLDVSFELQNQWVAVEVKSQISDVADIRRGMFQCVKYQAVLEAVLSVLGQPQNVRVVLALASPLPQELLSIKSALSIETVIVKRKDG